MFTGCLILKGEGDLSELWQHMIQDVPAALTIGNARQPEDTSFMEVSPDTALSEVLFTIHQKLQAGAYSYMLWSDERPRLTMIPNRSSTVALWADGGVIPEENANDPVKLLTRLNMTINTGQPSVEDTPGSNYATKVRDRVIRNISAPKWALTMLYAYISKPSFILSTKRMRMYMWLVIINNTYVLFWSTQSNLVKNMVERMDQVRQHQVFVYPIDFEPNTLLTIHPLFLISKLNSNIKKYTDPASKKILSASYIKNYITRMQIEVNFGPENEP